MSSICTHTHTFVIVISLGNFLVFVHAMVFHFGFLTWSFRLVWSLEVRRLSVSVSVVVIRVAAVSGVGIRLKWSRFVRSNRRQVHGVPAPSFDMPGRLHRESQGVRHSWCSVLPPKRWSTS
jgi:hypothetical protein